MLKLMIWDDPKLPDDNGEVRKPNGVVGGSMLGLEIVSLLDGINQVVKRLLCSRESKKIKNKKCLNR